MDTTSIKQDILIKASASEIYDILVDSKKHSELIGERVVLVRQKGGKFSAFDGWVKGEIIDLKQDEKIVQTWIPDEEGWPKDQPSIVTIELEDHGDNTTTIHFTQDSLPELIHEDFEKGWYDNYWNPLKKKLEK